MNIDNLRFRMLSYMDFHEFKRAVISSVETNEPYLAYGSIFNNVSVLEYVDIYMQMMKDKKIDHFGLFDGSTLLAHAQYQTGLGPLGTELIGWTRKEFQNQKIGEVGLITATNYGLVNKGFNYVELRIDSKNVPSRKLAEKVGFKPFLKLKPDPVHEQIFIYYVKFNPKIEALARRYDRRAIDIFNSPASVAPYHHFLHSPGVSSFYDWPFPEYSEDMKPISSSLLSAYLAIVNLHPDDLRAT